MPPTPLEASPRGFTGAVQTYRRRLALERRGRSLVEGVGVRAERAQGGLRDEDVVAGQTRCGLDAGRGVDRISDDRELAPPTSADRACNDAARVHTHSD